ncbi:MAG: SIR2 family protein [Myxococcota bacterium]
MVDISKELARAIQAGDCVLWVGAGFGALAGRPGWEPLLEELISACPEGSHEPLRALLEQGRLRTVLTYIHSNLGDDPLAKLLQKGGETKLDDGASALKEIPWRACLATTYADVVKTIFTDGDEAPQVLTPNTVHHLSLRDTEDFFVLETPPTVRSMRATSVLFDFVEELVRTRTILFLGFEPDDPDLVQILDLLERIGEGNRHFALLPLVSEPEAEEYKARYGIDVLHVDEDASLTSSIEAIGAAIGEVAVRPSDVAGEMARLDLVRAVRGVPLRADLAIDTALTVDVQWLQTLLDGLPNQALSGVPASALLSAGSVLLAHRNTERARRCFQQVVSDDAAPEFVHTARFNLAWCSLFEGDLEAAREGLASPDERSLALVPPRFEILDVRGFAGTQVLLHCRDRESQDVFDIAVSTLERPVGAAENNTFSELVQKLADVDHPAVCAVRGAFADGRLFGVMYDHEPGFVLADTFGDTPMDAAKTLELVIPMLEGLQACHAAGVHHRNINPRTTVAGAKGGMLRGFGFPPIVGFQRPSVQQENYGYLAPETVCGVGEAAADVYALAALTYRCVTGHVPAGSTLPASHYNAELDVRLDDVLRDALHPNPTKRSSLATLLEGLKHIADTPGEGAAIKAAREGAEPGAERVVDLGHPQAVDTEVSRSLQLSAPEDPDDLEAWAAILERKPTHLEARQNVDRIEDDARDAKRWDRLVEVLGVKAERAQRQQDRVKYLREMVSLFEKELGAPRNAFETLQALIESVEVAEQVKLADEVLRLASETGEWAPAAETLSVLAERAPTPEDQARLYATLAETYAERLGSPEQALASYGKAIELEPSESSLAATIPLHRKLGQEAELVGAYLSLADLQEGEAKCESLLAAAKLLRESLGDEEGAFGAVELVLEASPEHPEALELAESLAGSLERWDTLFDVLIKRASAADGEDSVTLRRQAVSVALEHLDDTDKAVAQLTTLTQDDRTDADSAALLAELLRPAAGEDAAARAGLVDVLGNLIDQAEAAEAQGALLTEQAALLDQMPDGKDRAIDCRERVLELLPVDHELAKAAADGLEAAYKRQDDAQKLASLAKQQAQADDVDPQFRAEAWARLYDLATGPLEDEDGAVEALEALTKLEPDSARWRDALLERYLAREEFEKAGPLIRAQVYAEEDPKRKAALLLRGGKLRAQIGKTEGAVEALEEAVSLDPELVEAWIELRNIYANNDQPLKAANALVSAAENNPNRAEKVRNLFEAAQAFVGNLERPVRGVELLEQVVELDPDHRDAMTLLLEQLIAENDLARAWPHAQVYVTQVKSQAGMDHAANLRALSLAGRCALAVDEKDKAREYLQKARGLDATNLDVLQLLADLDMDAEQWSDALRNYQSVVLGMGDKLPAAEQSQLYVKMARARIGMDEQTKAAQMLDRALDIDENNESAVDLLIELGGEVGGSGAVVKAKLRMADLLLRQIDKSEDEAEAETLIERRAKMLDEVADLQLGELNLPDEAVRTLEKVLETRPEDPAVLHKILDVFTTGQRWRDATNVLGRLADAQQSEVLKAKYLYAGALILRDNLDDRDQAIDWMRKVVSADPMHPKAFDAYLDQLIEKKSWSEVSKTVRTHLKALPKDTPPERLAGLFQRLGQAHEKMTDMKTAMAAYDQSVRMAAKAGAKPEDLRDRRERVIKLAISQGEDELSKATHHAHAIIADAPMDFDVYHQLVDLYVQQKQADRARSIAKTLRFLKKANEQETKLLEDAKGPGQVRTALTRDHWRKSVFHPSQNGRAADILSIVWALIAAREGQSHAHFDVARKDRVEVSLQSKAGLARYVAHACQMLDVSVPDLFQRDVDGMGVRVAALVDNSSGKSTVFPSLIAGKGATADASEVGMKFRAGRAVARVRPEHILTSVLPSAGSIRKVVYGGVAVGHPGAELPEDVRDGAKAYATELTPHLQPARIDQLKTLGASLAKGGSFDAKAFSEGVAYTTTRAAFVLCDSIETAAAMLTREGDEGSSVTAKDRIADLIAYSVSQPYLKLRKQLGLNR